MPRLAHGRAMTRLMLLVAGVGLLSLLVAASPATANTICEMDPKTMGGCAAGRVRDTVRDAIGPYEWLLDCPGSPLCPPEGGP